MKSVFVAIILAVLIVSISIWPYWVKQITYRLDTNPQGYQNLPEKLEANTLLVPALGIKAPIIYVDSNEEKTFEEALRAGVAHYPGTATVGEFGNAYIFGHSSDYVWAKGDYKTVFALLPKIKKGDEIIASNRQGDKFVYQVIETLIVSPKDTYLLDQGNYDRKKITLQTSYPVGTALKRFVAIAELREESNY